MPSWLVVAGGVIVGSNGYRVNVDMTLGGERILEVVFFSFRSKLL